MRRRFLITAALLFGAGACGTSHEEPEDATDVQPDELGRDDGQNDPETAPIEPDVTPPDHTPEQPTPEPGPTPEPQSTRTPQTLPSGGLDPRPSAPTPVEPAAARADARTIDEICEGVPVDERDQCPFDARSVNEVRTVDSGVLLRMGPRVRVGSLEDRIRCYQLRQDLRASQGNPCPLGDPEVVATVDRLDGRAEVTLVAGHHAAVLLLRQRAFAATRPAPRENRIGSSN